MAHEQRKPGTCPLPFSVMPGGKVGDAGLHERLVRTRAAMCSSIIPASNSSRGLPEPSPSDTADACSFLDRLQKRTFLKGSLGNQ